MKRNYFGKRILAWFLATIMVFSMIPVISVAAQDAFVFNGGPGNLETRNNGEHDRFHGWDYEYWSDGGTGTFTIQPSGAFSATWDGTPNRNILFRVGRRFGSPSGITLPHSSHGEISLNYGNVTFPDTNLNAQNVLLCVYGWFAPSPSTPTVEWYIIDSWGSYEKGRNGTCMNISCTHIAGQGCINPVRYRVGQYTVSGEGTYDLIVSNERVNVPSIFRSQDTFPQYIAIRTEKRTSGNVSVSEHFRQWQYLNLDTTGALYEVALCIEAWGSTGNAEVSSLNLSIAPAGSGFDFQSLLSTVNVGSNLNANASSPLYISGTPGTMTVREASPGGNRFIEVRDRISGGWQGRVYFDISSLNLGVGDVITLSLNVVNLRDSQRVWIDESPANWVNSHEPHSTNNGQTGNVDLVYTVPFPVPSLLAIHSDADGTGQRADYDITNISINRLQHFSPQQIYYNLEWDWSVQDPNRVGRINYWMYNRIINSAWTHHGAPITIDMLVEAAGGHTAFGFTWEEIQDHIDDDWGWMQNANPLRIAINQAISYLNNPSHSGASNEIARIIPGTRELHHWDTANLGDGTILTANWHYPATMGRVGKSDFDNMDVTIHRFNNRNFLHVAGRTANWQGLDIHDLHLVAGDTIRITGRISDWRPVDWQNGEWFSLRLLLNGDFNQTGSDTWNPQYAQGTVNDDGVFLIEHTITAANIAALTSSNTYRPNPPSAITSFRIHTEGNNAFRENADFYVYSIIAGNNLYDPDQPVINIQHTENFTPPPVTDDTGKFIRVYNRNDSWNGLQINMANIPGVNINTDTYEVTITGVYPNNAGSNVRIEEPLNGAPWANQFTGVQRNDSGASFSITLPAVNEAYFQSLPNSNREGDGTPRTIRVLTGSRNEFIITNIVITNTASNNVAWSLSRQLYTHNIGSDWSPWGSPTNGVVGAGARLQVVDASVLPVSPANLTLPQGHAYAWSMANNIGAWENWATEAGNDAIVTESDGVLFVNAGPETWGPGVDVFTQGLTLREGDTVQIAVTVTSDSPAESLRVSGVPGYGIVSGGSAINMTPSTTHVFTIVVDAEIAALQRLRIGRADGLTGGDFFVTGILVSYPVGAGELPAPPTFSQEGGFFNANIPLSFTAEAGTIIRYTTDGSIPIRSSPVFISGTTPPINIHAPEPTAANSPMSVTGVGRALEGGWIENFQPRFVYNGMVVRARAFYPDGRASDTITHSYFVDPDGMWDGVRTMSLTIEPRDFNHPITGLYRGWHRESWPYFDWEGSRQMVNMEMFERNGDLLFSQAARGWVFGNYTRQHAKRSLRFNFNNGDGDIRNMPELIPQTRRNYNDPLSFVSNFRHINARNDEQHNTGIRDAFVHLASEPLRPLIQNVDYGAIFVNGEFWGMYNFRAHRNAHLIGEAFGVPRNSVYMNNDDGQWANAGQIANLLNQHGYENLNNYVDVDDLIDMLIIGFHYGNWDWPGNNFEFWRTTEVIPGNPYADGRFRFIVQDFDHCMGSQAGTNRYFDNTLTDFTLVIPQGQQDDWRRQPWIANFFDNLFANAEFRNTFAARYSTYTGTVFNPALQLSILEDMVAEREPTIALDSYRWMMHGSTNHTDGINQWRNEIQGLRTWLNNRNDYSVGHIREHLNSSRPGLNLGLDASALTRIWWSVDHTAAGVSSNPGGWLDINGAQIREDLFARQGMIGFNVAGFDAEYIRGLPVTVTAMPNVGYVFSHFEVATWCSDTHDSTPTENINANPYTFTPPAGVGANVDITINAVFVPAVMNDITVESVGTGASANPNSATMGQTVTINAGIAPAGQRFSRWEADVVGVNFANEESAITTFTMVGEPVTVTASFVPLNLIDTPIVINQLYAGGDTGSNAVSHSFVELYNTTNARINLDGYSLQVQTTGDPAAAPPIAWDVINLEGFIEPRSSYLIVSDFGTSTAAGRRNLTNGEWDLLTNVEFGNRGLSVALVDNQDALSPFITGDEWDGIVDLVGAINSGPPRDRSDNFFVAPARVSRSQGARRTNFQNTQNNAEDFVAVRYAEITTDQWDILRPRSSADGRWGEAETFDITVNGGTAFPNPAEAGQNVTLTAGTPPVGQRFSHWETTSVIALADDNDVSTTFTMINAPVEVTAVFIPLVLHSNPIIINQVYGQGNSGNNAVSHSFVELYNPTNAAISLNGLSLQISNGVPNGAGPWTVLELTGEIGARSSFLVVGLPGGSTQNRHRVITNYDASFPVGFEFSNNNLAVALVNGTAELPAIVAGNAWVNVIDLVGVANDTGNFIANYLGENVNHVGSRNNAYRISRQIAVRRVNFTNTMNNRTDFASVSYEGLVANDANWAEFYPRWSGDGRWGEAAAFAVNVTGGTALPNPAEAGQTVAVTLTAEPAGQRFLHWTASPTVAFANANDINTTFTMINAPVEVTAVYSPLVLHDNPIIINQVYGGGNPANNAVSHSFVELYNPTNAAISLNGLSLQISNGVPNGAGTWTVLELTGEIGARSSFLVVGLPGGSTQNNHRVIANYDASFPVGFEFSNNNLAVALVNGTAALPELVLGNAWANVIDLVGVANDTGNFIANYLGENVNHVGSRNNDFRISRQIAVRRINFANTMNNRTDFRSVAYEGLVTNDANWAEFRPRSSHDGEWPLGNAVVVNGGAGASTNSIIAAQGQAVTVNAGAPPAGQRFSHWTVAPTSVSIQNHRIATFTMVDEPVTLTANFVPLVLHENPLIINQVYARGNNLTGNAVSHSFIELYNPSASPVVLDGLSVQVSERGESMITGSWSVLHLEGTLAARSSFLIVFGPGSTDTTGMRVIENYDVMWNSRTLNNRNVAVAIVNGSTPLPDIISGNAWDNVIDLVGVLNNDTDSIYHFLGAQPVLRISRQIALRRNNFANTLNNSADFESVSYETSTNAHWEQYRPRWSGDGMWPVATTFNLRNWLAGLNVGTLARDDINHAPVPLQVAGTVAQPIITVAYDNDTSVRSLVISDRAESWHTIDIQSATLQAGDRLAVRGRAAAGTQIFFNGGDEPWGVVGTNATPDANGIFILELTVTADHLSPGAPGTFDKFRIQTNNTLDFEIYDILINPPANWQDAPVPIGGGGTPEPVWPATILAASPGAGFTVNIFTLLSDTAINGANAPLITSGNPVIGRGQGGNTAAIVITNRENNWYGIDIVSALPNELKAGYEVVVTGRTSDLLGGLVQLSLSANPFTPFVTQGVAASSTFEMRLVLDATTHAALIDGSLNLRIQGAAGMPFIIDNITISAPQSTIITDATLLNATSNGAADTVTTTQIELSFNQNVTAAIAPHNVTVSNATVTAVTGSGATRTVTIEGSWLEDTQAEVSVSGLAGYTITGLRTVTLHRQAAAAANVTISNVTANGAAGTTTTTQLTLTFNQNVTATINTGNVTVSGANVIAVSGTGNTRTVTITGGWANGAQATVAVTGIAGYSFTNAPTVTLHRQQIVSDAPTITVGNVSGRAGTVVEVPILISNNPGISVISNLRIDLGVGLTLHYPQGQGAYGIDPVTWPFIARTGAGHWDGMIPIMGFPTDVNIGDSHVVFNFVDTNNPFDSTDNGVLVTLRLRIADGVAGGTNIPINIAIAGAGNLAENQISVATVNGSVSIPSFLYGDVNGDGRADAFDVQMLVRWVNSGGTVGTINEVAARITNSSGAPDAFDIQALVRWINAGGDPEVGHPGPNPN
jgi:hypothetical protein